MNPEHEDTREDDWDEEYAPRSIFAAGWFRAVLVLTSLAIVVVVALPYLLNWFEPAPAVVKVSPPQQASRPPAADSAGSTPPSAPPAAPSAPTAPAPPAPATPSASPPAAPARARPAPPATAVAPALPPPSVGAARAEREAAVSATPAPASEPSAGRYWVQLGVFKDAANAEHLAGKLRQQGFAVEVTRVTRGEAGSVPAGTYHLVRAGGYRDQTRAVAARDALREKGYAGFLIEGAQ
jgi:cell division protein FtsN